MTTKDKLYAYGELSGNHTPSQHKASIKQYDEMERPDEYLRTRYLGSIKRNVQFFFYLSIVNLAATLIIALT